MELFDFITDEEFRSSLEVDYQEMCGCLNAGAWKATHVLAGSVIEAVLVDYLIAENHVDRSLALKLDFSKALSHCLEKKIITSKTNDLCSVVREFRNLIHPGRIIRLNETITQESAQVAKSLVHIILGEVASQKRQNYGYTAEQIAAKIERDSSADAIILHLLRETNPIEIERLLLKILPELYLESIEREYSPPHVRSAFIKCFRTAFRLANDDLKKKVTLKFVKVLKEEDERVVFPYGQAFFRAEDLKYLQNKDVSLVKRHLLSRLKNDTDGELLDALTGIGTFLTANEVTEFTDPLVKLIAYYNDREVEEKAKERLRSESFSVPKETEEKLIARLNDWIKHFVKRDQNDLAELIDEIKKDLEIPF